MCDVNGRGWLGKGVRVQFCMQCADEISLSVRLSRLKLPAHGVISICVIFSVGSECPAPYAQIF